MAKWRQTDSRVILTGSGIGIDFGTLTVFVMLIFPVKKEHTSVSIQVKKKKRKKHFSRFLIYVRTFPTGVHLLMTNNPLDT